MTNEFGNLLRFYRQQCTDSERGKRLSQERLGELIGRELGDDGYSGAAVSDWENGKSQIHKDDRLVLASLIKVLHQCGGIKNLAEANTMLLTGNYRPLNPDEQQRAHLEGEPETSSPRFDDLLLLITIYLKERFTHTLENLRTLSNTNRGTAGHWSGRLLEKMGRALDHLSSEDVLLAVAWTAVWLLTLRFAFPLMGWPFADPLQARTAAIAYAVSSLALPLLIGGLTSTKADEFWQGQGLATSRVLRLYTQQGAIVGFHLGYAMVFAIAMLFHYLGVSRLPAWLYGLAAAWPVLLGYAAARQVPFNLWRAYNRLDLKDGAIFFVFALFGPLFGFFFFNFYSFLLAPDTGITIFLLAAGILAGLMTWQRRRRGSPTN